MEWMSINIADDADLQVEYKRVDDRRNKTYQAEFRFSTWVQAQGASWGCDAPPMTAALWEEFETYWPDGVTMRKNDLYTSAGSRASYDVTDGWQKQWGRVAFPVRIPAEKPSEILSEEAGLELLGGATCLLAGIRRAMRVANERFAQKQMRMQIANQAGHAAEEIAKRIIKESRKRMRYTQRRAALKAELQSEVSVTKGEELEALCAKVDWWETDAMRELVLKTMHANLQRKLDTQLSARFGSGMFTISPDDIELPDNAQQIFEEEDAAEESEDE